MSQPYVELASAIRKLANTLNEQCLTRTTETGDINTVEADAIEMLFVLARVAEGKSLLSAFNAPVDWSGEIEAALRQAHREPIPATTQQESDPKSARVIKILTDALEEIAAPYECGCMPCTGACRSPDAAELHGAMREIAGEALTAAKGGGA